MLPVPVVVDEEEALSEHYDPYPIYTGSHVTEGNSTFTGYAAEVESTQDVSNILNRALLLDGVAESTHLMFAFRIEAGTDNFLENFNFDGDDGIYWL